MDMNTEGSDKTPPFWLLRDPTLIEYVAVEKVKRHVAGTLVRGRKVTVGGTPLRGQFFKPTVVANATAEMLCAREVGMS